MSPACVRIDFLRLKSSVRFPGGSAVKESTCKAGDLGSTPGSGRSSGEGNGHSLQYPHHQMSGHELRQNFWETVKDRGAGRAAVRGVAKSRKQPQQTVEATLPQRPKPPSPAPGQPSVHGADPEEGRLPPPVLRRKEPGTRPPHSRHARSVRRSLILTLHNPAPHTWRVIPDSSWASLRLRMCWEKSTEEPSNMAESRNSKYFSLWLKIAAWFSTASLKIISVKVN